MSQPKQTRRAFHVLVFGAIWVATPSQAAFADVVSVTLNPTSVFGTDSSSGTVTLDLSIGRPARSVNLMSSNPSVASVPASVSTLHGGTTLHFTVTTYPVATSTNVTITATEGGVSKQTGITIRPPELTGVSFNPNPVRGGEASTATVTINRPAPVNWLCSIQGPYPPIYFTTGSIVSFTPGASSTTKTVNTQAVASPVDALITVRPPSGQTPNVSNTLTVVPLRAESITLDPRSMTGGAAAIGCVTLNGPAPVGGASVTLASSDPDVASVPAALQIAAGDNDGCFLVQSFVIAGCGSTTISATFGQQTVQATLDVGTAEQITDNAANDRWSSRHSSTVGGKVLWTDGNDVFLNNGVSTQLVQARGAFEAIEDTVFGLGSGQNAGQVIGAWRRGTDFAWVWKSGGQPVLVNAVNPIDPQQELNPEAIAIADGSVFMVLQAFAAGHAVKHAFRIDPVSGDATILSGGAPVPGVSRITTSGGQAAWLYVVSDEDAEAFMQFFNGSSVSTIDSGVINYVSPRLARGRLVYEKYVANVSHIVLYDSTAVNPAPQRVSPEANPAHGYFAPATDGYHLAWLSGDAEGTNLDVMLNGGLQLNDAANGAESMGVNEFPLQLQRGQVLWRDEQSVLQYARGGLIEELCPTPADSFKSPWLADGVVAGFGAVKNATQTDNEVFTFVGDGPNDAELPMPPILVESTPKAGRAILEWDGILGASSYNVYLAQSSGVTKQNYQILPGGRHVAGITNAATSICGLVNGREYHFVVTASDVDGEGGNSMEAATTPDPGLVPHLDEAVVLLECMAGPGGSSPPNGCRPFDFAVSDFDCDGVVSLRDFASASNLLVP